METLRIAFYYEAQPTQYIQKRGGPLSTTIDAKLYTIDDIDNIVCRLRQYNTTGNGNRMGIEYERNGNWQKFHPVIPFAMHCTIEMMKSI